MKRAFLFAAALAIVQFAGGRSSAQTTSVDQGPNWTRTDRAAFYSRNQGSRIMPLSWAMALKQPSGGSFMADSLSRYGYLKNEENLASTLPVGFTTDTDEDGVVAIGMNCAACHTRQIEVGGTQYRLDGGPAVADFQSFLTDLDKAVGTVLGNADAFKAFASTVLGGGLTPAQVAQLRTDVNTWYGPYHTIVTRALPTPAWGPSRLDAVGMIFNRLTGLDIGPANQNYMIPSNIQKADAPARYPFLWNASIQAKTQWPGFADNGDDLLALARNTGEVIGVFAKFHPVKDPIRHPALKYDFKGDTSVNTEGLLALEDLIKKIGPPKYQWPVDAALAAQGKALYEAPGSSGGCAGCHGIQEAADPLTRNVVWKTPILDVGTDSREYNVLKWQVNTGVLSGAKIPVIGKPLNPTDSAFNVLALSVEGIILQRLPNVARFIVDNEMNKHQQAHIHATLEEYTRALDGAFKKPPPDKDRPFKYESRVIQGIWAVAPYLHNGSVPTLTDLLNPVSERPKAFKIGPNYDPTGKVGLAAEQTKFDYTLKTTDCSNRNSGTSVCGHEFGVTLKPEEKRALLEYLKSL